MRVSASGGRPEPVTKLDPARGDMCHPWPQLLPGGEAVLFTARNADGTASSHVDAIVLKTGERRTLVRGATGGRVVAPGYLVYNEGNSLKAAPFDVARLQMSGPAAPIVEGVRDLYNFGGTESLAYVPGGNTVDSALFAVDRGGVAHPLPTPQRPYQVLEASPDGSRLAVVIGSDASDIWVYHLLRGTLTRVTHEGGLWPVWTPDGKQIAYVSRRNGARKLFLKSADGTGSEREMATGEINPKTWSPDGRFLVFTQLNASSRSWDVGLFSLEDRKMRPLLQSPFTETEPRISPDGRFIAFTSDESGQHEVYVQPFPEGGEKWQVSTDGGSMAEWSRDGRELYYVHENVVMAAAVETHPQFSVAKSRRWFSGEFYDYTVSAGSYAGQQVIVARENRKEGAPAQIHLVLNWLATLKSR